MRFLSVSLLCLFALPLMAQRLPVKRFQHEQVSFEDMIHRYLHRDGERASHVEGIYSVSCIITKTKRSLLSGREKVRVVQRRDNYARVAIMKETMSPKRDFIEVSMSNKDATKYLIVGELSGLAEGSGYVYKHIEPNGDILSFSMLLTHADLLEGQFAESKRKQIITTKLSYFKLYPKVDKNASVRN